MSVGTEFLGGGDSYMDSMGRIINRPRVYGTPMYTPTSEIDAQTQRLQMLLPLLSGLFGGGGAAGAAGGLGGFNTNYGASGSIGYNSGIQANPVMDQGQVSGQIAAANQQMAPKPMGGMYGRQAQQKFTGDQGRMGIAAGQNQGNAFSRNASQVNTTHLNNAQNARATSGLSGAGILQGLNQGMARATQPIRNWGIGQVLKNM